MTETLQRSVCSGREQQTNAVHVSAIASEGMRRSRDVTVYDSFGEIVVAEDDEAVRVSHTAAYKE